MNWIKIRDWIRGIKILTFFHSEVKKKLIAKAYDVRYEFMKFIIYSIEAIIVMCRICFAIKIVILLQ